PAALFVEADAAGMARGLGDLFARPEAKTRLSEAGRRLRDKYSPARMCAGYEALLLA
ncbi:MAG: glycosyltransferase family 4 protein, partial [Mesorhizobium sp.]